MSAPRFVRAAVIIAAVPAIVALAVVPAAAHGGIIPQPVVRDVPDAAPGLQAEGLVTYSPRIRVTNDHEIPVTVVDDSGRPWLRISQDGVFADVSVRAWWESLDASGRGTDPDPSTPSTWTQVSVLPTWEWFDTDLLPRTGEEEHDWSIPVVVEGEFDEIRGFLREDDLEGRWATDLQASGQIGDARLTAVSGPVPVFIIQLLDAEEVVVLGRYDEPLLRLTAAGFEVNRASPTWNDHARLDPNSAIGDVVEDPNADPVWEMQLEAAPTATWLDVRAASGDVAPQRRSATTIETSLPIIVDGERHDVPVATTWVGDEVPVLALRLTVPRLIAISLGAGLLAAGAVRLWERRRDGDAADDLGEDATVAPDESPTAPGGHLDT